jgi:hypothetical protein
MAYIQAINKSKDVAPEADPGNTASGNNNSSVPVEPGGKTLEIQPAFLPVEPFAV